MRWKSRRSPTARWRSGSSASIPIANGQVTREEIAKGEQDPEYRLAASTAPDMVRNKQKGARYTPVAKRQDKPDAIAWLVRHHPDLSDAQIGKLIGTTKETIAKVRDRTPLEYRPTSSRAIR